MKIKIKVLLMMLGLMVSLISKGIFFENYPVTIKQPNGKELEVFSTGDEFYSWMHDQNNYTIVQDKNKGYYCYAVISNGDLVASEYIVGEVKPETTELTPNINISQEAIREKVESFNVDILNKTKTVRVSTPPDYPFTGSMDNIVIFTRFADQTEFPANKDYYSGIFNNSTPGEISLKNYYKEVSYDMLDVSSSFYPISTGNTIISYQDSHIRDYYLPYSTTNDSGYVDDGYDRLYALAKRAVSYISSQVPSSLTVDCNGDGYVDNVCLIVRGDVGGVLTTCAANLISMDHEINNKIVDWFNVHIESRLNGSQPMRLLCHEMFHSFGAQDLYQYYTYDPVGSWDLMGITTEPPQHLSAYMKYKHGGWISSIPEITSSGTYTLNPLTSSTNNCYKISISSDPWEKQYYVLEYRKKEGNYENMVPGSGLVVYLVDEAYSGVGNRRGIGFGGEKREVFVFRKDGTPTVPGDFRDAHLSSNVNRTEFHNTSNPYCFTADGSLGNVLITNISSAGSTISFDIQFCEDDVVYSNTNSLPVISKASNSISTLGTVVVQSNDNVIFEAGDEVILNAGFEVQLNAVFEANIGECVDP